MLLTGKANGEAGHFAVMRHPEHPLPPSPTNDQVLDSINRCILIAGSKNVHIAFRDEDDLRAAEAETSSRTMVAAPLAHKWLSHLEGLSSMPPVAGNLLPAIPGSSPKEPEFPSRREQFLWMLMELRLTVCLEFLQPTSLHVERFPAGSPSVLCVITMVPTVDGDPNSPFMIKGLERGVSPAVASSVSSAFGLKHVGCDVIPIGDVAKVVKGTRQMDGLEGRVLYFLAPSASDPAATAAEGAEGADPSATPASSGAGDAAKEPAGLKLVALAE